MPPPEQQKTMFDFVSPFDALSSASSQVKKKPVPSHSVSSTEDSSWTTVSDPKRRSVDNLLEQMSNIRPYPQSVSAYDFYDPAPSDYTTVDSSRSRQPELQVPPPPIPPKPLVHQRPESPPRPSPPKTQAQRARLGESPVNNQQSVPQGNGNRRDKESSPGPRGSIRRARGGKNFVSSKYVKYMAFIFQLTYMRPVCNLRQLFSMLLNQWRRFKLRAISSSRPLSRWSSRTPSSCLVQRLELLIGSHML